RVHLHPGERWYIMETMKTAHRLFFLVLCALPLRFAFAGEWTVYRFEGRDYVSLDDIAAFYGFPKPPVPAVALNPAPGAQKVSAGVAPVAGVPAAANATPGTDATFAPTAD